MITVGAKKAMHVGRLRMIALALLISVVSACAHSTNPLIGKWTLAQESQNNYACINLAEVEFTEQTVTTGVGPIKSTVTVTYGRDGDSYLATAGNGQAYRVKTESGGIEANGCHLVAATGDSNPLIGKWKPAPGQDETCSALETIEFTEDTMTTVMTEQAQTARNLPSRIASDKVTYSRDGEFYVANSMGGAMKIKVESGGLEDFETNESCHFVPDN